MADRCPFCGSEETREAIDGYDWMLPGPPNRAYWRARPWLGRVNICESCGGLFPEPEAKRKARNRRLAYWYLAIFIAFGLFILIDYYIIH